MITVNVVGKREKGGEVNVVGGRGGGKCWKEVWKEKMPSQIGARDGLKGEKCWRL